MASEVFRPSNGELQVGTTIPKNSSQSVDYFRKSSAESREGSRPGTQNSSRFGSLSSSSFFARHNPHPSRVRHIKGLLDVPICSVSDDGYFANPRYSMQFPPNAFNSDKLKQFSKYYTMNLPVNAINVNSQRHPINTITGLQHFMGKPLNYRIFREKAIPRMGLVPVTETWRDELRALTESLGLGPEAAQQSTQQQQPLREAPPQGKSQYSNETGRLIPPPSRAISRGFSRAQRREKFFRHFSHITEEPDVENVILQMLCQILQTDDVNAVQAWLVSAGDREKALVMDMLKAAIASKDEYYKQPENVADFVRTPMAAEEYKRPQTGQNLPPERGIGDERVSQHIDRLSLMDASSPPPKTPSHSITNVGGDKLKLPEIKETSGGPQKAEYADRPKSGLARPLSRASSVRQNVEDFHVSPRLQVEDSRPTLRYTRTPVQEQNLDAQKMSLGNVLNGE